MSGTSTTIYHTPIAPDVIFLLGQLPNKQTYFARGQLKVKIEEAQKKKIQIMLGKVKRSLPFLLAKRPQKKALSGVT